VYVSTKLFSQWNLVYEIVRTKT